MSKLLLFLRPFLPRRWWIALLSVAARLRSRLGGETGAAHRWIWERVEPFGQEACQRLLNEELLPIHRTQFHFPLDELDVPKERVAGFLLAQTPINLRNGSQIGFVVSNVAELALLRFRCERRTVLRTME